jgi:hypothetical protein
MLFVSLCVAPPEEFTVFGFRFIGHFILVVSTAEPLVVLILYVLRDLCCSLMPFVVRRTSGGVHCLWFPLHRAF